MHINSWVQASDLMKMIKSANSTSTFSSEEGLPDNHVITIRERELTVDFPELIQNNIKTDTVTLDLDAEWDGIHPVIIFGPNASGTIAVEYTGEPVHIPGAVMQYVGGLDCSVMGLDDSGEVRLVTKAAPNTFEVVESGEYIGQISEDDVSLLGQILSAIEDVKTATSDASNAAEAATAAANSANTAATKATAAANSANTAATKANDAANSANTASERAENAYDVLTPIIAEIGVNGNQPRATTNPNHVATASDAYAAKPLGISIKGATRQNLWVNPSGTSNGVTVTANDDGSITVSGTASENTFIYVKSYVLRPGTTYVLSVDKKLTNGRGFFASVNNDNNESVYDAYVGGSSNTVLSRTFTVDASAAYVNFGITVDADQTVSGTYRVMLNEGSEPEPWCPPGLNSVEELSIVTEGKNLLSDTFSGIAYAGGAGVSSGTVRIPESLMGETVTVSMYKDGVLYESSGNQWAFYMGRGPHGEATDEMVTLVPTGRTGVVPFVPGGTFMFYANNNFSSGPCTIDVMLELGSTATAYEPPAVTSTPIDLDGNTLCSLPDGTHDELTIDATGAVTLTKRTWSDVFDGTENWINSTNRYGLNNGLTFYATVGIPVRDTMMADTLPVVDDFIGSSGIRAYSGRWVDAGIATMQGDLAGFKAWLGNNNTTLIYKLAEPQTIPLTAVTLPTLPSPNITVYHDSDVPSDITVEYVQDINIVLDNLNAKIAALNVAQSSSS